jgi:AcrR family transcriptional regulator
MLLPRQLAAPGRVAAASRSCQNRILVTKNDIPPGAPPTGVAARIAARTIARRGADYETEIRRILDAALALMAEQGTSTRVRVADIVAAAGVSNDAFYRHFASKDALVAALLEDGTDRLARYAAHQMEKEAAPAAQIRRWVDALLAQTREPTAAATLGVLWNGTGVDAGRHDAAMPLAVLLHEPLAALGCSDPALVATLLAHATLGRVADHLWERRRPARDEVERITEFCIRSATPAERRRASA